MNILQMVEQKGITPKRVSSNKGGEYHSSCPACGGGDRFHIWPTQGEDGSFWCRNCDKAGDAVAYLRLYEGMACSAAHATLGRVCTSSTCSKIGRCRQGAGGARREDGNTAAPVQHRGQKWTPSQAQAPESLWREHAEKLVASAHKALLASPDSLAYLAARGLPLEAVKRYSLGWLGKDNYRTREAWGLPTELKANGKSKKLYLPAGIVIPFHIEGQLHRLRIRRDVVTGDEPRYYWVPGSGNDVVVINPDARAFVVVESDLDGLMVDHAAGDLVGSVPLGTCSAKPKELAVQILRNSLAILVALDFEPRQNKQTGRIENPGGQATKWWLSNFPQARRWPTPVAKDPGEAYQVGVDIRTWVVAGLPPVMTMQSRGTHRVPQMLECLELKRSTKPVFDQTEMQILINDTFSRVFSQAPKGALEWLAQHCKDVVKHLSGIGREVDAAFETEDTSRLLRTLERWEKQHLSAWERHEKQ